MGGGSRPIPAVLLYLAIAVATILAAASSVNAHGGPRGACALDTSCEDPRSAPEARAMASRQGAPLSPRAASEDGRSRASCIHLSGVLANGTAEEGQYAASTPMTILRGGGGGSENFRGREVKLEGTMGFISSRLPARAAAAREMAADAVAALIDKQPLNIVRQHSDEFHQRQKLKGLPRWLSWMYQPSKSKAAMLVDPHQAVMIQAFDWDNMVFSKRSKLYSALADEMPKLAEAGVNIAWFPPPSSSADEHGYLPGKWYDIPYKGDLMRAVRSAEAHGVVSMADVVLNHRTAAMLSNTTGDWTSFEQPAWEEWAIVKDDWKCKPDDKLMFCPSNCTCGNPDTGENACYAPDIDHTNVRVQADVEMWLKWLREDVGFQAFRFDNTKGYHAKYTAQYISASNPVFSVGEYFDTNRNLLTTWIKESKGSSSIFDFGLRYKLKDSIKEDNFVHLKDEWFGPMMWYDKAHSVTFLDNHDTAGDLKDRFGAPEKIEMGYAFILTHPGVPCIFWQDWDSPLRDTLATLISLRNRGKVSSVSEWQLVKAEAGLYAGFVGSDLAVKLGSGAWSPNQGLEKRVWEGAANGVGWAVWLRKHDEN